MINKSWDTCSYLKAITARVYVGYMLVKPVERNNKLIFQVIENYFCIQVQNNSEKKNATVPFLVPPEK
jgi:hypothetical protein